MLLSIVLRLESSNSFRQYSVPVPYASGLGTHFNNTPYDAARLEPSNSLTPFNSPTTQKQSEPHPNSLITTSLIFPFSQLKNS